MKKKTNIAYPQPTLSSVNYDNLDEGFVSLIDVEYGAMQNCVHFLDKLEQALLSKKMIQIPEMIVIHLCCYLGVTTAVFNQDKGNNLEKEITNLVQRHAEFSLTQFNHYLSNSNLNNQSVLLDQLRNETSGSIVAQTLRLGRIIMDLMGNLSANRGDAPEKQKDLICPYNELFTFLIPLINKQYEQWQEDLGGLSVNYAINQLATQIGWLIGYFSYLEGPRNKNSYLELALPCITLYVDHTNKLKQAMHDNGQMLTDLQFVTNDNGSIDDTEITSLLNDIGKLSEKTHATIPHAITKSQKEVAIVKAGLEKLVIELIGEQMEVKVIYMSLFYFWFTLDAPLRGIKSEFLDKFSPFEDLGNIVSLIKKTTLELPDPEFSDDLKNLHSKMQSLKLNLPHPEEFDQVAADQVEYQSNRVNTAIHTLTSDYLNKDYHPEIIANILFSQWLRLSVFYGISEKDWQKMDYYFVEIIEAVRNYLPKIVKNNGVAYV